MIYLNILNINNQLDFYAIYYISLVTALNSDGNGCHVNFRWSSVVIIKKVEHPQGVWTGECNLLLSCSTQALCTDTITVGTVLHWKSVVLSP